MEDLFKMRRLLFSIQVLQLRVTRKVNLDLSGDLPNFLESTTHIRRDPAWRVLPVPPRLQRRHVDIGDLAPCDTQCFIKALQSPAQGIQVPPLSFIYITTWDQHNNCILYANTVTPKSSNLAAWSVALHFKLWHSSYPSSISLRCVGFCSLHANRVFSK